MITDTNFNVNKWINYHIQHSHKVTLFYSQDCRLTLMIFSLHSAVKWLHFTGVFDQFMQNHSVPNSSKFHGTWTFPPELHCSQVNGNVVMVKDYVKYLSWYFFDNLSFWKAKENTSDPILLQIILTKTITEIINIRGL